MAADMQIDKYVVKGVKKMFGLANTKIRLAREAETIWVKPKPLPLVKFIYAEYVESVDDAAEKLIQLKSDIDYDDPHIVAKTVLALMDIIEGVKHRFEPPELCVLVDEKIMREIEGKAAEGSKINILLMEEEVREGVNLYVGYNTPKNVIHYGRVPTTLVHYLVYAFNSEKLSQDNKLVNTDILLGHKTLILDAIYFAIKHYCGGVNEVDNSIR